MPISILKENDSVASAPTKFESSVVTDYSNRPTNSNSTVLLADESITAKMLVRADRDSAAASQLDVPFGSARRSGHVLVSGQRPTEWMVLGSDADTQAFVEALDKTGHVSVVDHTHSRALFRLSGAGAKAPLD